MTGKIDARLAELGIELPTPPAPAAAYVPFVKAAGLVYISGQVSAGADGLIKGKLGADADVEAGAAAAKTSAIALLAQLKVACDGDLDRVKKVVKLTGFVNSTPDFPDHPKVINGCSELMVAVFGAEIGSHARSAFGVANLPFGVATEVEGIFEIA
ncbi:Enamine deaminase RidA, house cleaning of reactive enamine intermediates, YjgF/YER057c/UK114 family [Albimonas donghaensis]|uniref:Enamine deaminase RidA, house cleaning of reactive enamine intermediates, YjgF/YER057c/UK114 family n=1 Tax=Albimonas donghaensis TaxID=356660 RepID=A0A1H2YG89_9RHOB|nr:RidA family protein [Albimonas donghaensis]MAS43484.1 RidA family protein [Paracoccaceae bacterium]MBR28574.1 RidA family protein [Paracoccaceae bacterium]SDX03644.1 Enamine deaminase RidA, house cleaning of reactive enamine intermediates, YjgF/YER057c/UK114 family [Albimonas donghaensis]